MIVKTKSRAFTLVELLITAAITVLIVVMLGWMLASVLNAASRISNRTDAFRDSRAALQLIERDFSNLVRTRWDPNAVPVPSPVTRPMAFLALTNIYSDPAVGNQQLFGLVSTRTNGNGDICSVGYYCAWDGKAYSLRRFFRGPAATFSALSSPGLSYVSESVLFQPNPPPGPAPTDDILARYVWGMVVKAYDDSGNALPYPLISDGSVSNQTRPQGYRVPSAIEISFKAMSPQAARTVTSVTSNPSDWIDSTRPNYQRLILPHVYEFGTRISLQ